MSVWRGQSVSSDPVSVRQQRPSVSRTLSTAMSLEKPVPRTARSVICGHTQRHTHKHGHKSSKTVLYRTRLGFRHPQNIVYSGYTDAVIVNAMLYPSWWFRATVYDVMLLWLTMIIINKEYLLTCLLTDEDMVSYGWLVLVLNGGPVCLDKYYKARLTPCDWRGLWGSTFDNICPSVCLSVCLQHWCLQCIRQRVSLYVTMQQAVAGDGGLWLRPIGWYTCLVTRYAIRSRSGFYGRHSPYGAARGTKRLKTMCTSWFTWSVGCRFLIVNRLSSQTLPWSP